MARNKRQLKDFKNEMISPKQAAGLKGGYNKGIGGTGSTGFVNWDDIEIREEGNKLIFSVSPIPTNNKKSRLFAR